MSYILEALKKSQQERELGRVPTLEASGIFSEDKEPAPAAHWGLLAVGLAALAVVIALYAALRTPVQPPVTVPAAQPDSAAGAESGTSRLPTDTGVADMPSLSSGIEPLVEAPPPKRVIRPRITERTEAFDQRPPAGYTPPEVMPYSEPTSSDEERPAGEEVSDTELSDGEVAEAMEPEVIDFNAVRPTPSPVPDDIAQDIEAFKQQVRREKAMPPPEGAHRPVRIKGDPTRLRLNAKQQAELPGYLMTVHVYDEDVSKRVVVINTLKYRQGEQTREGLWVERILPDGAVLSYKGNPFYVSR